MDIATGAEHSNPGHFTVKDDIAYFAVTDDTHGRELWQADFNQVTVLLSIDVTQTPNGTVVCDPSEVSTGGQSNCTATPAAGFELDAWQGACSGETSNTCTLSNITSNQSISANFKATNNNGNDSPLVFENGFE